MRTRNCQYVCRPLVRALIVFFVLLFCHEVFGQVYTPQGSLVTVVDRGEQLTAAQKEALKQEWTITYPRAFYWGEATTTYNCHAYAWSVSEGGKKYWMNTPNDDIYMTDGSYVITDQYDPKARKVSYGNDDHSAIKPSAGSAYLISKWGGACLMKHTYDDCPYTSTGLKFYKLSMEISGDEIVALPNNTTSVTRTYTLSNVPNGARVEWNVIDRGTIVSGQGSHSIQVEILGSGNCYISAKVHCSTGLVVQIPFNINVIASTAPIITDIQMFKYGQMEGEFTLMAVSNQPTGTFTWSVNKNAQLYEIPYPDDASFLQYPNIYKAARFYETGTYTITVVGSKSGTMDTYTYSKDFNITEMVNTTVPYQ